MTYATTWSSSPGNRGLRTLALACWARDPLGIQRPQTGHGSISTSGTAATSDGTADGSSGAPSVPADMAKVGPIEAELRDFSVSDGLAFMKISHPAMSVLRGAAIGLGLKDEYGSHDYVVSDNRHLLPDIVTEAICAAEHFRL